MDQITTKTVHLERTSEEDQVPAEWAVNQITAALNALTKDQRATAVVTGWRGASVQYQYRRSDLEMAQARNALLAEGLRSGAVNGLTREQVAELLQAAGMM